MVTANQKSILDIHPKKKKKSKYNTKDSHQVTKKRTKEERGRKRPTKTNPKQLIKWH